MIRQSMIRRDFGSAKLLFLIELMKLLYLLWDGRVDFYFCGYTKPSGINRLIDARGCFFVAGPRIELGTSGL